MSGLLPCPFCGAVAYQWEDGDVGCITCSGALPVEKWNRRITVTELHRSGAQEETEIQRLQALITRCCEIFDCRVSELYDQLTEITELHRSGAREQFNTVVSHLDLADMIIAGYKEYYDFPPQGESHMHDCIMDALRRQGAEGES